jgi:hypothetical protein
MIFMKILLVTLSVNFFLNLTEPERDFISNSKNISTDFSQFVLKMNSRKTGPGIEMNITLTMIWCQVVIQLVHIHMCTF